MKDTWEKLSEPHQGQEQVQLRSSIFVSSKYIEMSQCDVSVSSFATETAL